MKMCRPKLNAIILGMAAAGTFLSLSATAGELYFDYNKNTLGSSPNPSVFLFGNVGQTATISTLSGFSDNITLGSDGFFNYALSTAFQQSGTGILNNGFKISSTDPIAGYFVNREGFTTDMTYLLDSGSLGKEYVVSSFGGGFGEGSQFAVHATTDNTTVNITLPGGTLITKVLNAGETYKYAGGATDLTGTSVSASENVAVFGGHECAQVPQGTTYCDTLVEQMIPTSALSKTYALTASEGASITSLASDLVRVIATQDNTSVMVNGVAVATINKGQFYEFSLAANSGATVEGTAPVMVSQYLKGGQGANTDPAMALVPGSDTWLDSYRLATPSGAAAFVVNYASLVLKTADLSTLMLDGSLVDTTLFTGILGTSYSRGIVDLPLGLFDISAANPFLLMLGGGSNADSYFTFGGATFAPGISPPPPPPPTPSVPEPGSLGLLAVGMLLMRLVAGYQKKAK